MENIDEKETKVTKDYEKCGILALFSQKVADLNIRMDNFIDNNTFNLMDDFFHDKFKESEDEKNDSILIDKTYESNKLGYDVREYLISKIESRIESYDSLEHQIFIYQLKGKLFDLKAAYYDYLAICNSKKRDLNDLGMISNKNMKNHDYKNKIKKREKIKKEYGELIREANTTIDYSIIELCAALDIPLGLMPNSKIRAYCEAIYFDVTNGIYEPLSITKHINNKGYFSIYK